MKQVLSATSILVTTCGTNSLCCELKLIIILRFTECATGYFGQQCDRACQCYDETEVCDKSSGLCESGCMAGWTASDCQTGQHIGCSYHYETEHYSVVAVPSVNLSLFVPCVGPGAVKLGSYKWI